MLLLGPEERELAGIHLRDMGPRCLDSGAFELSQLSDLWVANAKQRVLPQDELAPLPFLAQKHHFRLAIKSDKGADEAQRFAEKWQVRLRTLGI